MNIADAKQQVADTLRAYLAKDEFGDYMLEPESMRPVFLMGPPGIGKTAIMRQVAHELGIGLVSYSMTHHTRQSALGLPYIVEESFDGAAQRVTHYTMSEIVASVHELVRDSGHAEGILFLDEVNCVSETLAPAMLQFLQFKTFGQHRIPDGWVVACAGNPPEYNNSVREFDVVTLDRLKRIDVEADYDAWKAYALAEGVHPSVTTYLELKKQNFYKVESTATGKEFVTARGWVDVARIISLYERCGISVDAKLVSQYLQNAEIARDFANYYQLYAKYEADYRVGDILAGSAPAQIMERARQAAFDERLSLLGMIFDAVAGRVDEATETQEYLGMLLELLLQVRDGRADRPAAQLAAAQRARLEEHLAADKRTRELTRRDRRVRERCAAFLAEARSEHAADDDVYPLLKEAYDGELSSFKERVAQVKAALDNAFEFLEMVYGDGQEMLIFVTNLTANEQAARFIAKYGCDKYFEHNDELLFYERHKKIEAELDGLDGLGL